MKKTLKIAFYGKGGIGKSTIASNVAVAFSEMGLRVLVIGCDPKADSTRNIMGEKIKPIIKLIQEKGEDLNIDDFMKTGFNGISCIETGGPEAGVGCAGRGITMLTEELENYGVLEMDWDIIIYDVLGDVVCGGFAVPMRDQYVDAVYIVTSSEFMTIYAANNIMKSVVRFSEDRAPFFGGIVYNQRNNDPRDEVISLFAKKTGSKITNIISFSKNIVISELDSGTTIEKFPQSSSSDEFRLLAENILKNKDYLVPSPLNELEMEEFSQEVLKIRMKEIKND